MAYASIFSENHNLLSRLSRLRSHASSAPSTLISPLMRFISASASLTMRLTRSSQVGISSMSPIEIPALQRVSWSFVQNRRKKELTTRRPLPDRRPHTPSFPWRRRPVRGDLQTSRRPADVQASPPRSRRNYETPERYSSASWTGSA